VIVAIVDVEGEPDERGEGDAFKGGDGLNFFRGRLGIAFLQGKGKRDRNCFSSYFWAKSLTDLKS
jgi:hypothetical protein